MKQVLLKKVVIIVDKLTKSRVLRGGVGIHRALRGRDGATKFSPSCGARRGGDGARQNLAVRRQKSPSFGPASPPLPSVIYSVVGRVG